MDLQTHLIENTSESTVTSVQYGFELALRSLRLKRPTSRMANIWDCNSIWDNDHHNGPVL